MENGVTVVHIDLNFPKHMGNKSPRLLFHPSSDIGPHLHVSIKLAAIGPGFYTRYTLDQFSGMQNEVFSRKVGQNAINLLINMVPIVSFLHGRFFFFRFCRLLDLCFWLHQNHNYDYLKEPNVHHVHADLKRPTCTRNLSISPVLE